MQGGLQPARSDPVCAHVQDFCMRRLQAVPGLRVRCPEGAFYIFADVRGVVGPGVRVAGFGPVPDDDALCRRALVHSLPAPGRLPVQPHAGGLHRYLLEQHAVGLVPGDAFGMAGFVRMSYAASLEQLGRALDRIQAGLAALSAASPRELAVA